MSLESLFNPKSIAVIGASTETGTVGNDVFKNLLTQGFKGKVYPINPKAELLLDQKCYPNITSLPIIPEMAVIVVPAKIVPFVLKECGQIGVKSAVVISAGFKEIGNLDLENDVKKIASENGITLLGVNCLGIMNVQNSMNATFAPKMPKAGNVSFISQSGALCSAVIDSANEFGLGFSKILSTGNKTSLDEIDILEYLDKDPETSVIMMYVESITSTNFLERARKLEKPIIVLKTGRSNEGQKAASSHTGALGGNDQIYEALFRQSGIIRAYTISDLFNYAQAFSRNNLPQGDKFAVLTNAGGPGGLTVDAVEISGLKMAQLSQKSIKELGSFLPVAANIHNPVDVLGDARSDRYAKSLEILLSDKAVDGVIVILTPQSVTQVVETAKVIANLKLIYDKPIIASFMGDVAVKAGKDFLFEHNVSQVNFPDQAAYCMSMLYFRKQFLDNRKKLANIADNVSEKTRKQIQKVIQKALLENQKLLQGNIADEILEAYGLPTLKKSVARNSEEALIEAKKIGGKLVLKIISPDIVHKSDAGGILLDVLPDKADSGFQTIIENVRLKAPEAKIDGVLIMEMAEVEDGFEIIIGSTNEGNLGKSLMIGFGGIFVEAIKDVTFSLGKLSIREAEMMIERLKSKALLYGVRGLPAMDIKALIQSLIRVSELVTDFPEISELDINPILILPDGKGCKVLDSRIILG